MQYEYSANIHKKTQNLPSSKLCTVFLRGLPLPLFGPSLTVDYYN